jgi:hypothetical protein
MISLEDIEELKNLKHQIKSKITYHKDHSEDVLQINC